MKFNPENWTPRTKIGEMVKNKQIVSVEQIFESGKPIKEVEIVDTLLPNLEMKVLEVSSVQRMTKNNRKGKYRATVVVGDRNGHVGIGSGKDVEVKPAIDSALKDAKKKIISINFGCGSWECSCGTQHSLPLQVRGKCGSAEIKLMPAPRGVGVVAGEVAKQVLEVAGIKDVWSFSRGRTRDIYNIAIATYIALKQISKLKSIERLKATA
ncbi:MAG: 30S ribosomal protein S5 [Candidatus Micrarchaeota archaeon]|nr:30S ribosomal protein S5 [Candidatus Micrarchaeota archaeon]MDE1804486.1 30S ribosomal protein S5 [Candidatus Micrarchaeota archaeon]MDE1846457.1 30S ribosomal protein S5 [Candidatus Micrarchaeota archaeon]